MFDPEATEEAAAQVAKMVSRMYRELLADGVDAERALEMTKAFIATLGTMNRTQQGE